MRKRIFLFTCLSLLWFGQPLFARIRVSVGFQDDKAIRTIKQFGNLTHKKHKGNFHTWSSFYDDRTHLFSLRAFGCRDESHKADIALQPTRFDGHGGWTGSKFLDLSETNGETLLRNCMPKFARTEEGSQGTLEGRYSTPKAEIVFILTVKENDPKLFVTIEIDPRKKLKGYTLTLTGYPSSIGRFSGKPSRRSRFIATAHRETDPAGKRLVLDTAKEFWVLCGDRVWDGSPTKAKVLPKDSPKGRKGHGPAALLFAPDEPTRVIADIYANKVVLRLYYPPGTRQIHLVLWQNFRDMDNAQALKYLKGLSCRRTKQGES